MSSPSAETTFSPALVGAEPTLDKNDSSHIISTKDLLHGMATALSIDHWEAPLEAACEYEPDPSLAINFLCMQPKEGDPEKQPESKPSKPEAARFQEIFVDLVGMECANLDAASPRHVLDDRFDSFLPKGEREFKDSLMEFLSNQSDEAKDTRAFKFLESMLRTQMGFRNSIYFWKKNKKAYTRKEDDQESLMASVMTHLPNLTNFWGGNKEELLNPIIMDAKDPLSVPSHGQSQPNPGQVFVCNSSVCDLQCDAFLCPASISFKKGRLTGSIVRQWMQDVLEANPVLKDNIQHPIFQFQHYAQHKRITTLKEWPWEEIAQSATSPIPLAVFGEVSLEMSQKAVSMTKGQRRDSLPSETAHVQFLVQTVLQFLNVAIAELKKHQAQPNCHRQRYLLALPVLGTGGGFAGDLAGQVIRQLLMILADYVWKTSLVDVVLVCADEATYTHAQTIRHQCLQQDNNPSFPCFQQLDAHQRQSALQLARLASKRQLALFLGAGVSIGSGLPGWFGLLNTIEDVFTPTGATAERSLGDQTHWDPLAMADELQEWCKSRTDRQGQKASLKERVCQYISNHASRPGLLLALLISIPCWSLVTQNYDQLIEKACQSWSNAANVVFEEEAASKKQISVIPYHPQRGSRHWLLKLHGCVTAPNEIVLTSEDYKDKESRSKTLAGLVQASLMTQHLLFVGFSLSDPNYLTIVDQVRNALGPYHAEKNNK